MRLYSFIPTLVATLVGWTSTGAAADVLPPVSQRYATATTTESPDFQRHLVPLLGKLGCNGRACHGSFQGRGGFRLSLFGYDFKMDHEGLSERIDTDVPSDSYALLKALNKEPHEGGKRFNEGSWEHHLFLKWITDGARPRPENAASLVKLDVQPAEVLFQAADQKRPLQAIAIWSDGSREDVTCLCRFTSNDDAIVEVTSDGLLTSGDVGDTHVVISYDNAVVPIPVIRPVSDKVGEKYPQVAASKPIDRAIVDKLSKLGIVPSEACGDAEFLRRVSLDVSGTLPSAADVRAFLADNSPDKRERKINELLETPAYAAWWTTRICDWTGCNDNQLNNVNPAARQSGSSDWYNWVYDRVTKNMPYDELMEGIVVAESRLPNETYREYCDRMSSYYHDKKGDFGESPGLIYFWGRQNFRTNEDRAIGFAYTFMGTRIQCAQCHKHPFDVWTQEDFQQFEKFFTRVNFNRTGDDRSTYQAILEELGVAGKKTGNDQRRALQAAVAEGKTIPFPEITIRTSSSAAKRKTDKTKGKKEVAKPQPQMARLLGSEEVDLANIADPRTALMDWLRHDPKQLFAKALVNRVWANYFHRGIVEPTDDLSLANPPSNQAVLDYLATEFVKHDYDLKWLHREICLSDTYQRSWRPNETNVQDERNFSHAIPRRLPAEVAYDALIAATTNDARSEEFASNLKGRAISIPGVGRNNNNGPNYALTVFGRSTRESNCDCDRSVEASLLQVIFTRNDNDVHDMISRKDGWVAQHDRSTSKNDKSTRSAAVSAKIDAVEKQLDRARESLAAAKKAGKEKRLDAARTRVDQLKQQLANLQPKQPASPAPEPPMDQVGIAQLVDDAYLRTLSRFPSEEERQLAAEFLSDGPMSEGASGLLWTLVNTKEFIVNH
ncbi:MAG: DUF1549 and DUF1553 domain-containing protein [Planctomycetaceae bacterium]